MKWKIQWSIQSDSGTILGNARISGKKVVDALDGFLRNKKNAEKRIISIEAVKEKPRKGKAMAS